MRELSQLMKGWLVDQLQALHPNQTSQGHPISPDQKRLFSSLLFDSFAGYDRLSRVESTSKILGGMEVKELYEPARLTRIINLVSNAASVEQLRTTGNLEILDVFETLKAFIKVEATCKSLLEQEKIGTVAPADSLLELQITDYDGDGIEPARLSTALAVLTELQMNIARLLRVEDHGLTLKYLDSGSDFKIGIEGVKEAIDALRNLIESVWDRIRFRDHDAFERNIQAISRGLDFLDKVKQAVDNRAVTQEEADNIKTRVLQGVNELIGLGVTLPLTGESSAVERKQLIEKRSTKLLTSGAAPPETPVTADPDEP